MKLHISDRSSVHHQELFTVQSAMVYVVQFCRQISSSRIRMELHGQRNCPKHVQFHSKNKFEKLVYLVGFIIRKFVMMHGHKKIKFSVSCSVTFLLRFHLFVICLLRGNLFQPFSCYVAWRLTYLKFNNHISLLSLNDIKIRLLCLHARVIPLVHVLAVHYRPSICTCQH
jgi:hypothetical protein